MIAPAERAALAAALLIGLLLAAPAPSVRAEGKPACRGPLLLITVDALRADRLGATGYRPDGRSLTPRLDGLIAQGTHIRKMWAASPTQQDALGSMLTSRYPSELWAGAVAAKPAAAATRAGSLFELLGKAGYRTIASSSTTRELTALPGARGVSEWVGVHGAAPELVERLRALAKTEQRIAAWVHFSALHTGQGECAGKPAVARRSAMPADYDRRLAAVDGCIGSLLDAWAAQGLADSGAVFVIGVRGADLGERGPSSRAALFEEQLRVPVVVRVPGAPLLNVDVPTSTLDLVPTVLALVGEQPPSGSRGRSLLPLIQGRGAATDKVRPIFAELLATSHGVRERMLMVDGHKLIHRRAGNQYALYNLREDRKEQRELLHDPVSRVALDTLRARLTRFEQQPR